MKNKKMSQEGLNYLAYYLIGFMSGIGIMLGIFGIAILVLLLELLGV